MFTFEDTSECTYYFTWTTPHACPVSESSEQCLVRQGDRLYDLSPLSASAAKGAVAVKNSPDKILINVCAAVQSERCPDGSGACLLREGESPLSLGRFADVVPAVDAGGVAFLRYAGGDTCHEGTYSTQITFVCSKTVRLRVLERL